MSSKIIIVSDDNKLLQYSSHIFGKGCEIINYTYDHPDIDSLDVNKVVDTKLTNVYKELISIHGPNINVICEKIGLDIDNMKGFPGALISVYHKTLGNDGICFFNGNSHAIMTTCIGLINKNGKYIFEEQLKGKILNNENNNNTMNLNDGWDAVFIPHLSISNKQHFTKTYHQLPTDIKYKINGKFKCMDQLKKYIMGQVTNKVNAKVNAKVNNTLGYLSKQEMIDIIKTDISKNRLRSISKKNTVLKSKSISKSKSKSISKNKVVNENLY